MPLGPAQINGSWRVLMAIQTKAGSKTSPREVIERAKAEGVEVVDVRFIDLPGTWQHYSRDARFIAKKAEEHLRRSGIADVSYWGPEAEFSLFYSLRFDQNAFSGYYHIDSDEGIWNSGKNSEPNLAFRPRHKEGYFPVPPTDKLQDLRSEIMLKLIEAGVQVEVQHHE